MADVLDTPEVNVHLFHNDQTEHRTFTFSIRGKTSVLAKSLLLGYTNCQDN